MAIDGHPRRIWQTLKYRDVVEKFEQPQINELTGGMIVVTFACASESPTYT